MELMWNLQQKMQNVLLKKNVKFTSRNTSENLKVKIDYPKYKNDLGGWLIPAYESWRKLLINLFL